MSNLLSNEQKAFRDQIGAVRTKLGMTQVEFANLIGASRKTIENWESGATLPNGEKLIEIKKKGDVAIAELFGEAVGEKSIYQIYGLNKYTLACLKAMNIEAGGFQDRLINDIILSLSSVIDDMASNYHLLVYYAKEYAKKQNNLSDEEKTELLDNVKYARRGICLSLMGMLETLEEKQLSGTWNSQTWDNYIMEITRAHADRVDSLQDEIEQQYEPTEEEIEDYDLYIKRREEEGV